MGILQRLRFSRGLRWGASTPQMDWRAIGEVAGLLALILMANGIIGRFDYEEELRQERAIAEQRAGLNQGALLACLNGHAPGFYLEDANGNRRYLVCEKAREIDIGKMAAR